MLSSRRRQGQHGHAARPAPAVLAEEDFDGESVQVRLPYRRPRGIRPGTPGLPRQPPGTGPSGGGPPQAVATLPGGSSPASANARPCCLAKSCQLRTHNGSREIRREICDWHRPDSESVARSLTIQPTSETPCSAVLLGIRPRPFHSRRKPRLLLTLSSSGRISESVS